MKWPPGANHSLGVEAFSSFICSHDTGQCPIVFGSAQAVHALPNVRCSLEGHGALMQRTPVSTSPHTGLYSLVHA